MDNTPLNFKAIKLGYDNLSGGADFFGSLSIKRSFDLPSSYLRDLFKCPHELDCILGKCGLLVNMQSAHRRTLSLLHIGRCFGVSVDTH